MVVGTVAGGANRATCTEELAWTCCIGTLVYTVVLGFAAVELQMFCNASEV